MSKPLCLAALCAGVLLAGIPALQAQPAPQPASDAVTYLEQGWDATLREKFYFTPQGSRLMPYRWFLALEQPGSESLFTDRAFLSRLGVIYAEPTPSQLNPDGLPIGFVKEPGEAPVMEWAGMTCAACHTSNVTAGGRTVRIDGAPASLDFTNFLRALVGAVQATMFEPGAEPLKGQKFQRFAARVLGGNLNENSAKRLAGEFSSFATTFIGYSEMRMPTQPVGPGRVDALTQIINALAVYDLGIADNFRIPAAPVSYPFLWLTPKLEWVQWAPIASDPIGRNAGEVLGVFGKATLQLKPAEPQPHTRIGRYLRDKKQKTPGDDFKSTILLENLHLMEQWLTDLTPPKWPEDLLGKIDQDLGRRGAALFGRDCGSCHNMPPFRMTAAEENIAGKQFIKIAGVNLRAAGTDPTYTQSLATRLTRTGSLAPKFQNRPIVPGAEFFATAVGETVKRGLAELKLTPQEQLEYHGYRFKARKPGAKPGTPPEPYEPAKDAVTQLKAGPLLGIWATGPFLHNGSVPNIDELLKAPEERSKVFWIGNREVDAQKLGFVSIEAPGLFRFDTSLPGNGNGGHRFPATPYTEDERHAVIEYLKDPERFADAAPR